MAYNGLVTPWPELTRVRQAAPSGPGQGDLFSR